MTTEKLTALVETLTLDIDGALTSNVAFDDCVLASITVVQDLAEGRGACVVPRRVRGAWRAPDPGAQTADQSHGASPEDIEFEAERSGLNSRAPCGVARAVESRLLRGDEVLH